MPDHAIAHVEGVVNPAACLCCGAQARVFTAVNAVDGELIEIGSRRSGKQEASIADKAAFFGELLWLKETRGRRDGLGGTSIPGKVRRMAQRPARSPRRPATGLAGDHELGQVARNGLRQSEAPMTKKRRGAHPDASRLADSAAHAALSREVRPLLEALDDIAERRGQDKNEPMLVEVEPGRFVEIRLSDRWRKLGGASAGNIEHARRLVDLAEAAFEAERATKQ
jgi:hypothetical protein